MIRLRVASFTGVLHPPGFVMRHMSGTPGVSDRACRLGRACAGGGEHSYLTQVPPLRQGRCWQTGGSQLWMFLPPKASPTRSTSLESTWRSRRHPTRPLTSWVWSRSSQLEGTPPRNMGPNEAWGIWCKSRFKMSTVF